jgi:hypothetical protein
VKLGTKEYPVEKAADPSAFALEIRRQLTDERRSLRVYGSEVVIARLTADATRARIYVLNYGIRELVGVRIRVRGAYQKGEAFIPGQGRVALGELSAADGATEFSMPSMQVYAVVDLSGS